MSGAVSEVDEKYGISEKVEKKYDELDKKYELRDKAAIVGEAAGELYDQAAAKASDVVGDVKVGLAIGHIDIDPWAGPPTGEFHVRPAAARDGDYRYLAAGEAQFPAPFCGAHEALLLRVGAHGIAVTATATGNAHLSGRRGCCRSPRSRARSPHGDHG